MLTARWRTTSDFDGLSPSAFYNRTHCELSGPRSFDREAGTDRQACGSHRLGRRLQIAADADDARHRAFEFAADFVADALWRVRRQDDPLEFDELADTGKRSPQLLDDPVLPAFEQIVIG